MVTPEKIKEAIARVTSRETFLGELLRDTLAWPIREDIEGPQDLGYAWTEEDLRAQNLEERLLEGQVWQIQLRGNQPWGIFLVEFAQAEVYRTVLRQVLRGLVPSRRRRHDLPAWDHEHLLFLCTTRDYKRFTFAHFRGQKAQQAKLATFGWEQGDSRLRTLCGFNLQPLEWPEGQEHDAEAWLKRWATGFDKEPLTKDFFRRFDAAIDAVKADLEKYQKLSPADAYSRAQLLLERLLFLYFLQNRGWLDQKRDYLLHHFQPHRARPEEFSFYESFLEKLFWTLASAPGQGGRLPGIPFLNGGLFDDDEFAPTPNRQKHHPPLRIRNGTFATVFSELLEAFNFTVREDTPLDQDVAVDPEMLGKVFESIVLHAEAADPDAVAPDKRKATGSYYTPRIVVHFICREALLQYLRRHPSGVNWDERLKALFELDAANGLNADDLAKLKALLKPEEGAALRDKLRDLKCCDPASGSGAFPVGLLHELLVLRRIAETAANGYVDPVRKNGTRWLHDVKEQIVQDCLFGVDIQQQAIEICRLRLWLTLVVDYDIGLDPFTAERQQFLEAIGKISQLPNLEMNFHRGDSLLDMISDVPVRIEPGALGHHKTTVTEIQKLTHQLHKATKGERKKELRIEILRRRLDLTEAVLQEQLEKFEGEDSVQNSWLFEGLGADAEKRRRLSAEMQKVQTAIAKVQADRTELEKLAKRRLDADFYPKLRRLEGADFDSPFNFAWQLDFADIFTPEQGGFDIIVGNPPFVTARNPKKRQLYRERWPGVCHMKFLLICPFFELSFDLLNPGGQLGFIVSNAFAKREFGQPLIEDFFPTVELQKIVDCSGLMFPGHGTPTCIVFGAHRRPGEKTSVRVAAILPGGGDLRTPPEESPLWQTLEANHDNPGFENAQVAVADQDRKEMSRWPWSFDVSAAPTQRFLEDQRVPLIDFLAGEIGFDLVTGSDEFFVLSVDCARRLGIPREILRSFYTGEGIRNWNLSSSAVAIFPYNKGKAIQLGTGEFKSYAASFKWHLESRIYFGETPSERGIKWWEYAIVLWGKRETPLRVAFSQIATHAHFVRSDSANLFKEKAPIIKLPDSATVEHYDLLVGLLNASTALFWLKQVCFNKGAGEDELRDRFEFAGNKVDGLPVPLCLGHALRGKTISLTDRLTTLSRDCWECGRQLPALSLQTLFHKADEAYHDRNSWLPGYVLPVAEFRNPFKRTIELRGALQRVIERREQLRAEMIARQEEMDWLIYAAYGLIPEAGPVLLDADLSLAREQRPFCLWAEASGDLNRAVKLIPVDWSATRRTLWELRLRLIRDNEHVRRIEQPVYKRRWDEQWKVQGRWVCGQPAYDAEFLEAFGWWLSEKAEWWLETQKGGGPVALADWTAALWADPRVQAAWEVAAETRHRLELWKAEQEEARPAKAPSVDASRTAFGKFFKALVKEQAVPEGIPFGKPWEDVERKRSVPKAVKTIRGKLNVPRERFWTDSDGNYRVAQFA